MKIGIDLRSLENSTQHRGIGVYASHLIEALGEIDTKNEYIFFVSHNKATPPKFKLPESFQHRHATGGRKSLRTIKYVRILYVMPKALFVDKYGLDVFFQLDSSYPVRSSKTPVVSVLFDLIPYIYKDVYQYVHLGGYTPGRLIGYARTKLYWKILTKWLQRYKQATHIISISENSKQDLLKFVPELNLRSITAVPLAAASLTGEAKLSAENRKKAFKNFFFYIGGVDPRKGLLQVVADMEAVWQKFPETNVVFAGKEITDMEVPAAIKLKEAIDRSSRPRQIFRLGFIQKSELKWFYEHAVGLAFASRYEGFGLPILEAMQAGCPVVCYDNSSLPEVAGDAALVVKDGEPMAGAFIKLLENPALRERLRKKGLKQAAQFSWEKTARQTLKILEKTARSPS